MYLLDTNVFDYIIKASIPICTLKSKSPIYITNVQFSEIKNIPDIKKRNSLLSIIQELKPIVLPLESGVWLDSLYWDDSGTWIDKIGNIYIQILANGNGYGDALSGEVAKSNQLTLITDDKRFANKALKLGIKVLSIEDFFKVC